jgi:cytochrome b subunit of formate dehydrogenase
MFARTSMLLEHVVGSECRRCYACVAACPQIEQPLKEYVRAFRRVERASHWTLLVSYLALLATGVLINHWSEGLPKDLRLLLGTVHRVFTVGLVFAPVLYAVMDRDHFAMALRRSLSWSAADGAWFRSTWAWLKSGGKAPGAVLNRGAFNPGQRLWYLYVPVAIAGFGGSGIVKWVGPSVFSSSAVSTATYVHVVVAVLTDVLLVVHVLLKFVAPAVRDGVRGARRVLAYRQRRASAASQHH